MTMEAKKVIAIAVDDQEQIRVPAGRDPERDWALPDADIRIEQHGTAKAAAAAAAAGDVERAEALAEVRDYLRDILRRHRLANDPEYAEEDRLRREWHLADPDLDPRLLDLYLDTTILDNEQLREFLGGLTIQKIWEYAAPVQKERRPRPHPRMSPEPDVVLNVIGGREGPGVQRGKAAEWWRWSNRGMWIAETGEMVKNPEAARHGRARRAQPRQRPRGRQSKQTS